jgi:hypothetical protein
MERPVNLTAAPTTPGEPTLDELRERVATNATKRFSVICLQCGLSVDRLIHAETAQTEIDPAAYRRKCKDRTQCGRFLLSGTGTRRRKV